MIIAVIGNYDPPPHVYALAEGVGKELGRRGITLVCGGLTGVMEAVCKGSKAENGTTIGILPGGSPRTANEWVDFPVATNMGFARNVAVVSTGQAVIAVGGGVRYPVGNRLRAQLWHPRGVATQLAADPARGRSARGRQLHHRR